MNSVLRLPDTSQMDIEEAKQTIRAAIRERRAARAHAFSDEWVAPALDFTQGAIRLRVMFRYLLSLLLRRFWMRWRLRGRRFCCRSLGRV